MTKQQIDAKRCMIIATCKSQIKQMHAILKAFGEIPGIADNGDANILINDILIRIDNSERDAFIFKTKPDDFIERYDFNDYKKFMDGKIEFYKSRQKFYAFNAAWRQRYRNDNFDL